MNKNFRTRAFLGFFVLLLFSLADIQRAGATEAASLTHPRIEWDHGTVTLVQTNGGYGRITRLRDGRLICGFDVRGKIYVRHSVDGAKSWGERIQVAEWAHGYLTNTELLQLRDGSLLCAYNERSRNSVEVAGATRQETHPYSIAITRSDDGGQTWKNPDRLYSAGREFTNGCWEPAMIQLPSGEVQLFFANESPYRNSDEQEITLLRSRDGARTWSEPERVSFRRGARDGMPVPLVLKEGRGIVFAIEDNGLSGNFKPVINFTTLNDNWRSGVREPGNTNRWSALKELPPPHVAASAPYLAQLPSGQTLLSFQRTDTGEIRDAYMVVCIGDRDARHFDLSSVPFPVENIRKSQVWNSLFVKDHTTIIAVSQTTLKGVHGIWTVQGRFIEK